MTTRSLCISAAVLLLAMTLAWPAFPGRSNTSHQSSGAGAGIVNFQSIPGDEENGLVLVRRDADNQP